MGWSSLLYLLFGVRWPSQAEVYLDGRACGEMYDRERVGLRRAKFGSVFQQHFLIDCLTALENIMAAALVEDKAHAVQAEALLANLGLGGKLDRCPYELPGGERRRVAVGRAMVHRPWTIFADEPAGTRHRLAGVGPAARLLHRGQPGGRDPHPGDFGRSGPGHHHA